MLCSVVVNKLEQEKLYSINNFRYTNARLGNAGAGRSFYPEICPPFGEICYEHFDVNFGSAESTFLF